MGLWASKEGRLAREEKSKSELCRCEAGKPSWPTLPRGVQVRKSGHPINKLRARTNEDKGKDRQGWAKGKDG